MREYDAQTVRQKAEKTMPEDLNIPIDWAFPKPHGSNKPVYLGSDGHDDEISEQLMVTVSKDDQFEHYLKMSPVPIGIFNTLSLSTPSDDQYAEDATALLGKFINSMTESQRRYFASLMFDHMHKESITPEKVSTVGSRNDSRAIIILALKGKLRIDLRPRTNSTKEALHTLWLNEKEAVFFRCIEDKVFSGSCGKKYRKCAWHNKSIQISTEQGAEFANLEYTTDGLDDFRESDSAYSLFTKRTILNVDGDFYTPKDNSGLGECIVLGVLDHLVYLKSESKLPSSIPHQDEIERYRENRQAKLTMVPNFVKSLQSFMIDKENFSQVMKLMKHLSSSFEDLRKQLKPRGLDNRSKRQEYVELIKYKADMLDKIDRNDVDTWLDEFYIYIISYWLKLPIRVCQIASCKGKQKFLVLGDTTQEVPFDESDECLDPLAAKKPEMELEIPCLLFLHDADKPLTPKPYSNWDSAHYMYFQPYESQEDDNRVIFDASIEHMRSLYSISKRVDEAPFINDDETLFGELDGYKVMKNSEFYVIAHADESHYTVRSVNGDHNEQKISHQDATLPYSEQMRKETTAYLKKNGFQLRQHLKDFTQSTYCNCFPIAFTLLLAILHAHVTDSEFTLTKALLSEGEHLGNALKEKMKFGKADSMDLDDILQNFASMKDLLVGGVNPSNAKPNLFNYKHQQYDLKEQAAQMSKDLLTLDGDFQIKVGSEWLHSLFFHA